MTTTSYMLELSPNKTVSNQTSSKFTTNYSPAIICKPDVIKGYNHSHQLIDIRDKQWEIGLVKCQLTNIVLNISESQHNNVLEYTNPSLGGTPGSIVIPDGMYSIQTLNNFIQYIMKDLGHYSPLDPVNGVYKDTYWITLLPFTPNGRVDLRLEDDTTLDLTNDNSVADILGFEHEVISSSQHGTKAPKFGPKASGSASGIDRYRVMCDLIRTSSYNNSSSSECIFTFYPSGSASSIITINPERPIYFPIETQNVNHITMSLVDQNDRLIPLLGDISYILHLRRSSI